MLNHHPATKTYCWLLFFYVKAVKPTKHLWLHEEIQKTLVWSQFKRPELFGCEAAAGNLVCLHGPLAAAEPPPSERAPGLPRRRPQIFFCFHLFSAFLRVHARDHCPARDCATSSTTAGVLWRTRQQNTLGVGGGTQEVLTRRCLFMKIMLLRSASKDF